MATVPIFKVSKSAVPYNYSVLKICVVKIFKRNAILKIASYWRKQKYLDSTR